MRVSTSPAAAEEVLESYDSSARRDVLWIGGETPRQLVAELLGSNFSLVSLERDTTELDARAPRARCLLLEVAPGAKDMNWAARIIDVALDHGLLVLFTIPSFAEDDDAEKEARDLCFELSKQLVVPGTVRALYCDWDRIASAIGRHDPKSGCNRSLQLDGDVPSDPAAVLLLQRSFWDFEGINLELVQSGKSGAAVWIARPSVRDRRRRAAPFLVKWNSIRKTAEERSNVTQYACNTVSFRLTPPLHQARCLEGRSTGVLVFDFIDRAITFASAIQHYPAGQLIGSLFDHTLAGSLGIAIDVARNPVMSLEKNGLLRWNALIDAALCARSVDTTVPSVEDLRGHLGNLPTMPHRVGTVHGDMHVGNLLVATGSSDVLLIDFGKILYEMPVVADAACLEVSMSFATMESRGALGRSGPYSDFDWLTKAYTYPLDPHAVPLRADRQRWLPEALRAVRGSARQHDPSVFSYALAIVAYLLRFASYPDNGSLEDRAAAYAIAAQITNDMTAALKVSTPRQC